MVWEGARSMPHGKQSPEPGQVSDPQSPAPGSPAPSPAPRMSGLPGNIPSCRCPGTKSFSRNFYQGPKAGTKQTSQEGEGH